MADQIPDSEQVINPPHFKARNIDNWNKLNDEQKQVRARKIAEAIVGLYKSPEANGRGLDECLTHYINSRTFGEVAAEITVLVMNLISDENEPFDLRRAPVDEDEEPKKKNEYQRQQELFRDLKRYRIIFGEES